MTTYQYQTQGPSRPSPRPYEENHQYLSHPGWFFLMRFNKAGIHIVKDALQRRNETIRSDGGQVLGIAQSHSIKVVQGGEGWVTHGRMVNKGSSWYVQNSPEQLETDMCVLVMWFHSVQKGLEWIVGDVYFKQVDFPHPYGMDIIALPVYEMPDQRSRTLVLTEYPRIDNPDQFRDAFARPSEQLMRSSKVQAYPQFIRAMTVPPTSPEDRVSRHVRGYWLKRNSIVSAHMFSSFDTALDYFYRNEEARRLRQVEETLSYPTTIIMDLADRVFGR
ncbi:hypothetical protein ACJMK2_009249 [Sinanodonta woodiana]|uniref:Uncharacterized protein n=1 Tax=Sinanodonta woodiana TaxID=1069815 RepID=A0ABD3VDC7_SINWO